VSWTVFDRWPPPWLDRISLTVLPTTDSAFSSNCTTQFRYRSISETGRVLSKD
jgi:hypothetical protein